MNPRLTRAKIAAAIIAALLLGIGLVAQHRWDAQCAAEMPGSHWNGDLWMCSFQ